mmetsp:Transcript_35271/g.99432  ORF Transcript_35271/g.99432 Transcript_35271/m.99432 type:complete len:518 (-) Transcript_35271:240-1793(-)
MAAKKPTAPAELSGVGADLYRKIADLEKTLTGLDDENIADWEAGQEVDPEKLELQERIAYLEEQQVKILARYEHMRQTLSTVSEQVFRLKQKLRYHRSEAILNMAKALSTDTNVPSDPEVLKEMVIALRNENKQLASRAPETARAVRARAAGGGGPSGERPDRGTRAAPLKSGQNLVLEGDVIQAGTKPQLLGCLLSKVNPDAAFSLDFLSVYPAFLSGTVLLQNVITRFESTQDKSQQLRVFNIIKCWINCNYLDFHEDPTLKGQLLEFIPSMADVVSEKQTTMLKALLEKKIATMETEPKTYLIPKSKEWNLLKLDGGELARQMTLHDSKLFRLIEPRQCLANPDDLLISKRMKKVEQWVDREMKKSKKKSYTIKKFIEIIEHCRRLRNLHSTFLLLDAVRNSSDDNRKLINKGIKKMTDLHNMTDPKNNYENYRNFLNEKKLPTIPAFKFEYALFQESLEVPAEIGEGDNTLVNFAKYRKAAKALQEIQFFQKAPYEKSLELNPTLMGYCQTLP